MHSQGSWRRTHRVAQVWPSGHTTRPAVQVPPQPSGAAHATPSGQFGRQASQRPPTQVAPAAHEAQPQELMQRPLSQTSPAAHDTPAQGLAEHTPFRHDWPSGQRTPAQRSGGSHAMCGA